MILTSFKGVPASGDGVGLSVTANGGSVLVELKISENEWREAKNYTADAAEIFTPAGLAFRITATGGASFTIGNAIGVA